MTKPKRAQVAPKTQTIEALRAVAGGEEPPRDLATGQSSGKRQH